MYKLYYSKEASKYLEKADTWLTRKVFLNMVEISNGDIIGKNIKKMPGYIDTYRLRIGDYRVVYEKHDDVLLIKVIKVGPRGDVYKRLNKG